MNINLDNIVTISVNERSGIEKLNIRYVRTNILPSSDNFQNNLERHGVVGNNSGNCQSKREITREGMGDKSVIRDSTTSLACDISPDLKSQRATKQSYFFGQNPLSSIEKREEDKDSVLYKVSMQYFHIIAILVG